MWFIGLALAVVGALIAFASKPLSERMPTLWAHDAVLWFKPWAFHLVAFGLGIVVGGW